MSEYITSLKSLLNILKSTPNLNEKINLLSKSIDFSSISIDFKKRLEALTQQQKYLLFSFFILDQKQIMQEKDIDDEVFYSFLKMLNELDSLYDDLGGIIGYHVTFLDLLKSKKICSKVNEKKILYHHPEGLNLQKNSIGVRQAIRSGIENTEKMAEIYPVGGAGDRLNLQDEATQELLPAAELHFKGHTLLEGLIRDLQAREYLYYKLTGKQAMVPIAIMTSYEKNNHYHILKIIENTKWFGRNKERFKFFIQPLVPVISEQGDWVMQGPLQPLLKPGGHGVIWKLANDAGIFEWLQKLGCTHGLIRQINNPIAGIDFGICAFIGHGIKEQKAFGFASCSRRLNASEGMNVLIEHSGLDGVDYCISNVEYTEFESHGIKDIPAEPGSKFSTFPANTNILFFDIAALKPVLKQYPLPGMIINMKSHITRCEKDGTETSLAIGRLESTMQNIADNICDHFSQRLSKVSPEKLRTYITYNDRSKTISVTKRSYTPEKSPFETPESCFYDLLKNYEELFAKYCHFQLPSLGSMEEYLNDGPPFIILLHPCLGPFFEIISQKIQKGVMHAHAELQLEVAELDIRNLDLEGSLIIKAENIFGTPQYGENNGKCLLHNVRIQNKGINRETTKQYWKNELKHHEALNIILHGNGEFVAKDVTFKGSQQIEVPDGYRMTAFQENDTVAYKTEKISKPSWYWQYAFTDDDKIKLMNLHQEVGDNLF